MAVKEGPTDPPYPQPPPCHHPSLSSPPPCQSYHPPQQPHPCSVEDEGRAVEDWSALVVADDPRATEVPVRPSHFTRCETFRITNCPLLSRLPACLVNFEALETLRVCHATLPVVDVAFPPTLRVLEISYSCVREFRPAAALPAALAELDLSFNRLAEVPAAVVDAFDATAGRLRLCLRGNDFWYTRYSDLPDSMISAATVRELATAHRLGLLGTAKLRHAEQRLAQKRCGAEAAWLARQVDAEVARRAGRGGEGLEKGLPATTHSNPQNVHLRSVQDATLASVCWIMEQPPCEQLVQLIQVTGGGERSDRAVVEAVLDALDALPPPALSAAERRASLEDAPKIGLGGVPYATLLLRVYSVASRLPEPRQALAVLRDELRDGVGTCLTGRMTRIVNALGGFVPQVAVAVSRNEELADSIIALRKRLAAVHHHHQRGDRDAYVEHAVPAVLQLLEDACVPEAEHSAWLEYV